MFYYQKFEERCEKQKKMKWIILSLFVLLLIFSFFLRVPQAVFPKLTPQAKIIQLMGLSVDVPLSNEKQEFISGFSLWEFRLLSDKKELVFEVKEKTVFDNNWLNISNETWKSDAWNKVVSSEVKNETVYKWKVEPWALGNRIVEVDKKTSSIPLTSQEKEQMKENFISRNTKKDVLFWLKVLEIIIFIPFLWSVFVFFKYSLSPKKYFIYKNLFFALCPLWVLNNYLLGPLSIIFVIG